MLKIDRNKIIDDTWVLEKVNDYPICDSFECGDDDLNDYFHNDVKLHKNELLT